MKSRTLLNEVCEEDQRLEGLKMHGGEPGLYFQCQETPLEGYKQGHDLRPTLYVFPLSPPLSDEENHVSWLSLVFLRV